MALLGFRRLGCDTQKRKRRRSFTCKMSAIEYNNLLGQISQRLDQRDAGQQLLVICRGKLSPRNEESISTSSLFLELEDKGFLSPDRLTLLTGILEGVEERAFLRKVKTFERKRKEYNNLREQIIRELDELKDLERLISICKGNITEERRASIHDVRSLFKELESKDCLEIVKEILTQTEKTVLLKEVEEFEQRQSRCLSKFERQKGISPGLPRCKNL